MIQCKAILNAEEKEGILELSENGRFLRFSVERGLVFKEKQVIRDIHTDDIQQVSFYDEELTVTWQGADTMVDTYTALEPQKMETIYHRLDQALEEREETARQREEAEVEQRLILKATNCTMQTIHGLLDILLNIQGRTDWKATENSLVHLKQTATQDEPPASAELGLDYKDLSTAIHNRRFTKITEDIYILLEQAYQGFQQLEVSDNKFLQRLHPNFHDCRKMVEAYLIFTDTVLAALVKDPDAENQKNSLIEQLEQISETTDTKIDATTIDQALEDLIAEPENKKLIQQARKSFQSQINRLTPGKQKEEVKSGN